MFEKMSEKDWNLATRCKVEGTWNLHGLSNTDLDFFVLLSSVSGIIGYTRQSAYAAGNAFLDTLAKYRTSIGLKAVSLDLGWMQDEGMVTESNEVNWNLDRLASSSQ